MGSKPRDYDVGEWSIYYRPNIMTNPPMHVKGRGREGEEKFYMILSMMFDHGQFHLETFENFLKNYKQNMEVRKNGFR